MRALALFALLAGCAPDASQEPLHVFAAASMSDVAADLAEAYEVGTGVPVVVTTGASSTLARQIAAGAPANIVLLVGDEWPAWLAERGLVEPSMWTVAEGAMAVAIRRDARRWSHLGAITEAERVAMADPAHVPAGSLAKAMLERAGLWGEVESRVVPFPHVRAALAAVEAGQVDAAVVYASDLGVSGRVKSAVEIPAEAQPRVTFRCSAVLGRGAQARERFCTEAARRDDLWLRRGFWPAGPAR